MKRKLECMHMYLNNLLYFQNWHFPEKSILKIPSWDIPTIARFITFSTSPWPAEKAPHFLKNWRLASLKKRLVANFVIDLQNSVVFWIRNKCLEFIRFMTWFGSCHFCFSSNLLIICPWGITNPIMYVYGYIIFHATPLIIW